MNNETVTFMESTSRTASFYRNSIRESSLLRSTRSFLFQYKMFRFAMKGLFPFCWLGPGDKAVQIGCAEWLLDFGVSQALIMSTIVGASGHVLVIEPDPQNVSALRRYIKKNKISNMTVIQKAAWSEKRMMKFTVYGDRSSSNVITDIRYRDYDQTFIDTDNVRNTGEIEICADTIDNIVRELGYHPDFVNMTINGAEYEALLGLEKSFDKDVVMAFPIWGARNWYRDCLEMLGRNGYHHYVSDAPYTLRSSSEGGKVRLWKPRDVPQHIYAVAAKSSHYENRHFDVHEALIKKQEDSGIFEITPVVAP